MAHGTPDWGQTAGAATVFQLEDMAELAARLGSPSIFHRSGDVMFLDTFDAGLGGYQLAASGAGAASDLTVTDPLVGQFAARLVGGSDGQGFASLRRRLALPTVSLFAFEHAFALRSTISTMRQDLIIYTDTQLINGAIRWDDTNNELSYLNASAAWVVFATGVSLHLSIRLYHTWKLVMDAVNGLYVRAIVDNVTYSLANIVPFVAAGGVAPHVEAIVRLDSRAGQNDTVHVDRLVITQNEPA